MTSSKLMASCKLMGDNGERLQVLFEHCEPVGLPFVDDELVAVQADEEGQASVQLPVGLLVRAFARPAERRGSLHACLILNHIQEGAK